VLVNVEILKSTNGGEAKFQYDFPIVPIKDDIVVFNDHNFIVVERSINPKTKEIKIIIGRV